MIPIEIDVFFAAAVAFAVAAFLAVELLNQWRERRRFDRSRARSVFCCAVCGKIYSDAPDVPENVPVEPDEARPCPHCGRKNFRMKF